jgi:hypothetical protein
VAAVVLIAEFVRSLGAVDLLGVWDATAALWWTGS